MKVFLVPTGGDHHELYCEASQPVEDAEPATGIRTWWAKAIAIFRRAIAEGEAARDPGGAESVPRGRIRRIVTRKLAEAVAEQRLLWYLRKETAARLIHPDDMTSERALEIARMQLKRDHDKHRLWCGIDALLTIVSAPVALLPGPNVLAYYFIFRTVGHYLSMAGAQQGMSRLAWACEASPHLTALRQALTLDPPARDARVSAIAVALGLERLNAFVDQPDPQSA